MHSSKREDIKDILSKQQVPVIEKSTDLTTEFDQLFLRYLQAIHINEAVNMNDHLLIGRLWLNLHWLFTDAKDEGMKRYCAEKAAPLLKRAFEENMITDEYSKQSVALTISCLYTLCQVNDEARKFCEIAINGEDENIKTLAMRQKARIPK